MEPLVAGNNISIEVTHPDGETERVRGAFERMAVDGEHLFLVIEEEEDVRRYYITSAITDIVLL